MSDISNQPRMILGDPKQLILESSTVDPEKLQTYLDDLNIQVWKRGSESVRTMMSLAINDRTQETRPVATSSVTLPETVAVDPTWHAASIVRRICRTVDDVEHCRSPGLEQLVESRVYFHPMRSKIFNYGGILHTKPGVVITKQCLIGLEERCAECGYRISLAKWISGSEIRRKGLARRHYFAHVDIAEQGWIQPCDRVTILEKYNNLGFKNAFGMDPDELEVLSVAALVRDRGVPWDVVNCWARKFTGNLLENSDDLRRSCSIGDCKSVAVFFDPSFTSRPVFVVNGHIPNYIGKYEEDNFRSYIFLLEKASKNALEWKRMRKEFCGVTDPAFALPGSIRGDSYRGLFPLAGRNAECVSRVANGIHLSNGAIEYVRDAAIWFDVSINGTETGNELTRAGIDAKNVLSAPYVDYLGQCHIVSALTDGCNALEAAEIIRRGKFSSVREMKTNRSRLRYIDVAVSIAKMLLPDNKVVAIVAVGSVVCNRPIRNSELEIWVITNAGPDEDRVKSFRRENIPVILRHISKHFLYSLLDTANNTSVALSSLGNITTGVPLWDPERLLEDWRSRYIHLGPPKKAIARSETNIGNMIQRIKNGSLNRLELWETLRCTYDRVAELALTIHPVRYHKPEWVIGDLNYIGSKYIVKGLTAAYGISNAESVARKTIELSHQYYNAVKETSGIGVSAQNPCKSCIHKLHTTLTDASRLWNAGYSIEALYVARRSLCFGGFGFSDCCKSLSGATLPCGAPVLGDPRLSTLYLLAAFGTLQLSSPSEKLVNGCLDAFDELSDFLKLTFSLD